MTHRPLSGIIPIIPTPFTETEDIDEYALCDLIDFAIASGVQGVCLPAYASEYYKLTDSERCRTVKVAADHAAKRLQIVAQSNHPSLKIAIGLALENIAAGADVISLAVPRIFNLPESSVYTYLSGFLRAIPATPVLIQDFNPGGASLSVRLVKELWEHHDNFAYLKLEEPLCGPKVTEIIHATGHKLGVMEGWGGLYLLELVPLGIAGVMPGLGVADILQKVFQLRRDGHDAKAFEIFERVMPQIFFSLQNMELFHYAEKKLLMARNILKNCHTRTASFIPDASTAAYIDELNHRVVQLAKEIGR